MSGDTVTIRAGSVSDTVATLVRRVSGAPRDERGELVTSKLPDEELAAFRGLIGHYHIQSNKTDPGPALQWDYLVRSARSQIGPAPR